MRALAEVLDQPDGLGAAHAALVVGQGAHLQSQDSQNTQGRDDGGDQGFDQGKAIGMPIAGTSQAHGIPSWPTTRMRPPDETQMPWVAAEVIPAGDGAMAKPMAVSPPN